ncbi:MAG TPA: SLATT domain-containing protein, partial [Gemmatimonadales bacterium]|nr:SLATT domain-containing protein [Gemmatimonadales bacterium]
QQDIWVALTTAVVTALATRLQADQVETSLVQYNQALASLQNIESWWEALSGWEKNRRNNIDLLVEQVERVLESETAGWVQQMQSALDKLTEKEPAAKAEKATA